MDKLIFYSPAPREIRKRKNPTIRISEEAFDLVEEISAKTGLTNSFVVSEMVKFAVKNSEIHYSDKFEKGGSPNGNKQQTSLTNCCKGFNRKFDCGN